MYCDLKKSLPPERIELSTPGLLDQCSNHWAMGAPTTAPSFSHLYRFHTTAHIQLQHYARAKSINTHLLSPFRHSWHVLYIHCHSLTHSLHHLTTRHYHHFFSTSEATNHLVTAMSNQSHNLHSCFTHYNHKVNIGKRQLTFYNTHLCVHQSWPTYCSQCM